MAKKMQRLEASTDFRPFKFRIQAFTNAFHDDLVTNGLTEDILPLRKVKLYLWKHRYISRFNEDGKKQKSKGNHVWNIEARKIFNTGTFSPPSPATPTEGLAVSADQHMNGVDSKSGHSNGRSTNTSDVVYDTAASNSGNASNGGADGIENEDDNDGFGRVRSGKVGGGVGIVRRPASPVRWEFREYSSRIAGQVIKFARVGVPYVYSPRIWDAQMSCKSLNLL